MVSSGQHRYDPGDEPVSDYRLIEFIGEGTFGEVWKASSPGGASVAMKFISLAEGEGYVEFAALQRVKHVRHPNLTSVNASWLRGKDGKIMDEATAQQIAEQSAVPTAGGLRRTVRLRDTASFPRPSELIVAMGLGDKTLFEELRDCQSRGQEGIPPAKLLDYMEGAAKGIDFLNEARHDFGRGGKKMSIIHGDIKPANLLLVGGAAQVCDFGLATAVETARETQHIRGSVAYAAPEALDKKRHVASDQYSLAVSYVELRTGDLPFSHDSSVAQIVAAHLRGRLDLTRLSPGEQDVIKRATLLDPDRRWQSCSKMVRRLQRAVEEASDTVAEDSLADDRPPPESEITETAPERETPLSGTLPPSISSSPKGTLIVPSGGSGEAEKTHRDGGLPTVLAKEIETRETPEAAKRTIARRDTDIEPDLPVEPGGRDDQTPNARPWLGRAAVAVVILAIPVAAWCWWNNWEWNIRSAIDKGTEPLAAIMAPIDEPPGRVSFGTIKELEEYAHTKWLEHASAHEKALRFKEAIVKYDELVAFFKDEQATTGRDRVGDVWLDRARQRLGKKDFRGALEDCNGVIAALSNDSDEARTLQSEILEGFQEDWKQRVPDRQWALAAALAELDDVASGGLLADLRKELRDHARTVRLNQAAADMLDGEFDNAIVAYDELLAPDCFPEASETVALRKIAVQCRDAEAKLQGQVKAGTPSLKQIIEDFEAAAPSGFPETKKELLKEYALQVWLARSRSELEAGDRAAAKATCLEVLDYDPDNVEAQALLKEIEEGDPLEAPLIYEAFMAFGSADGRTASDFPRVVELCDKILAGPGFENDAEATLLRARAQIRLGNIDAAKSGLESLTLLDLPDHLRLLYLTLKAATDGFKTEEGVTTALDRLKRFGVSWPDAEAKMEDAESAQPPSAGDDPPRIKASFWRPDSREMAGLDNARNEVYKTALAEVQSLLRGDDLAGATIILDLAAEVIKGTHTAPDDELVSQIDMYDTLLDPQAEPKATGGAIAVAKGRILRTPVKEQTALAVALAQTAKKNHDYDTLKPELLSAIDVVRRASTDNQLAKEVHKQLGTLWEALIALRINEQGLPAEADQDELGKLADDWDQTIRGSHDSGLIDAWRAECMLVLNGDAPEALRLAKDVKLPDGAKDQREAYVSYVQASTLTEPSGVLAKLSRVFPDPMPPKLPKFLTAGKYARLIKTITMTNEATRKHRLTAGWNLPRSTADREQAMQLAAFLWRVYDSLQEEEKTSGTTVPIDSEQRTQLKMNLALAELRSQTAAETSPPPADPEAAPSPRDLMQLFDDRELGKILDADQKGDTIPVLQMVLRISLLRAKASSDASASRRHAMRACSRLVTLIRGGKSDGQSLDDQQILDFYGKTVEPVLTLAAAVEEELKKSPAAAQPQRLADARALEELYTSVANLIRDRDRVKWPFPTQQRLADLYSRAIQLHVAWPPGQPSGKELSGYHVRRGYARVALKKLDGPDGALSDAEAAEKAAGGPGKSRGSDGLKCYVYLLKAQASSLNRVENLQKSIDAGNRAVDGCPDNEPLLPYYLSDLTNAYVWRANFLVGDFDRQEADLLAAEKHANRLLALPGTRFTGAYIASGNALEDLAWKVGRDPVANYKKALAAFRQVRPVDPRFSEAASAIGRLYYKYLVESSLDPALLEDPRDDEGAMLGKATLMLDKVLDEDPGRLEACYYAGKIAEYKQDYTAAKKQYEIVRDKWSSKKKEVYWRHCIAAWAGLPLVEQRDWERTLTQLSGTSPSLASLANTVVLLQARSAMNVENPDYPQILAMLQKAIPDDLADATIEHIELLRARVTCYRLMSDKTASQETTEGAIRDAKRIGTLTTSRHFMASAQIDVANIGLLLFDALRRHQGTDRYDEKESREALDRAIQHGRDAVALARRHPENWRARLVLARLLGRLWIVEPRDSLQQMEKGIVILEEAVDLLVEGASRTEDSRLSTIIARNPTWEGTRKTLLQVKEDIAGRLTEEKAMRAKKKTASD